MSMLIYFSLIITILLNVRILCIIWIYMSVKKTNLKKKNALVTFLFHSLLFLFFIRFSSIKVGDEQCTMGRGRAGWSGRRKCIRNFPLNCTVRKSRVWIQGKPFCITSATVPITFMSLSLSLFTWWQTSPIEVPWWLVENRCPPKRLRWLVASLTWWEGEECCSLELLVTRA